MIRMTDEVIKMDKSSEKIIKWVVKFMTPEGLHDDLKEAKEVCDTEGYPYTAIRPVPVALSANNYEVCFK